MIDPPASYGALVQYLADVHESSWTSPVDADPAGRPVLTVAMPARNAAAFIGAALRSVLTQPAPPLEVIVVDDASEDGTSSVVESVDDPRVTLVRNQRRQGIGACHNTVLERGRGTYLMHVDADDVVLPGALMAMVEALEADPGVGQVYCDFYEIDRSGGLSPEDFQGRAAVFHGRGAEGDELGRDLLVHGMMVNHLRTYRMEAVKDAGGFLADVAHGEDWAMAVALADRWTLRRVEGFFYCRRVHGGNASVGSSYTPMRFWRNRVAMTRALLAGGIRPAGRSPAVAYALLGYGLLHAAGLVTRSGRPQGH